MAKALSCALRPTTKKLYDIQWASFTTFCDNHGWQPLQTTPPQVAEYFVFLRSEKGLKAASINTHLAAILSVMKKRSDDFDVSVLKSLIKSFRQEDGRRQPRPPQWDLGLVLEHLKSDFYEPLEDTTRQRLTVKTVFLVAMASAARVSELHALQADLLRFEQRDGGAAILGLDPTFVCKNQGVDERGRSFTIPALHEDNTSASALSLCPVRALKTYAQRTRELRGVRRRLIIPHSVNSTKEIDKRAIAVYLRSAVIEAYKAADLPAPRANPHEIRAVSASMAYHCNVPVADIMRGCFWKSELVFANHYLRTISTEDLEGVSRLGPQVFAQTRTFVPGRTSGAHRHAS